jgi:monofunctional biosynthetic peptidoglycan transglycosylase
MTYVIEAVWGKRRIMEVYLNVAEWGDGIFGAEAASQARFGKPASELTGYEAALLASVLPSPNKWSATSPGPYVRKRVRTVQARMREVAQGELAACVLGP